MTALLEQGRDDAGQNREDDESTDIDGELPLVGIDEQQGAEAESKDHSRKQHAVIVERARRRAHDSRRAADATIVGMLGAALLFTGLAVVYWAVWRLPSSVNLEVAALLAAFFGGLALTDALVEIFDRRRPVLAGAFLFLLAIAGVRLVGQPLSDPPFLTTLLSTAVVVVVAYLVVSLVPRARTEGSRIYEAVAAPRTRLFLALGLLTAALFIQLRVILGA